MTPITHPHGATTYQFRIVGHLDHHWSPWFGHLILTHHQDGTTTLTGVVADQAELHGLLIKIRDLGVTLVSVAAVEPVPTISACRPENPAAQPSLSERRQHGRS